MDLHKKNYFKIALIFVLCLSARLIPFRAPNVEPILATIMPLGGIYGILVGVLFAILSIFFYDIITGTSGMQTFFTAGAYGILGFLSAVYFKKNKANIWNYFLFAIFGTIFFDVLTGFTVGPMFFNQSLYEAMIGQVPFTALHLVGNVVFALTLSPIVYHFLIKKREKELVPIISVPNTKTI